MGGVKAEAASLVERAQAGEAEAFEELCRQHATPLLRHALSLCGNAQLAEELAHETLVEAWRCLRRYNGRCQLFTWLCAILINRYRNTRRQREGISLETLREHQRSFEPLPGTPVPPDESAQMQEKAAEVFHCVQRLPEKFQQVIYLRFYVDQSLEGIAEALDCSIGTIKSRLFRALEALRAMNAIRAQRTPAAAMKGTTI